MSNMLSIFLPFFTFYAVRSSTIGVRPYTSEYTAVYLSIYGRMLEVYGERFALNLACCARVA